MSEWLVSGFVGRNQSVDACLNEKNRIRTHSAGSFLDIHDLGRDRTVRPQTLRDVWSWVDAFATATSGHPDMLVGIVSKVGPVLVHEDP